jgi:hypothetical protein
VVGDESRRRKLYQDIEDKRAVEIIAVLLAGA